MTDQENHTNVEVAVQLPEILKILGWSARKFHDPRWKRALTGENSPDGYPVIFKQRRHEWRSGPRWMAFPSALKRWMAQQAKKNVIL